MKIKIENLGILRHAEFELGDMTIICGSNNSGKTYATYVLYGFLSYWREAYSLKISDRIIDELMTEGSVNLNIEEFIQDANSIIKDACSSYEKLIYKVLGSEKKYFENSKFGIDISNKEIRPIKEFNRELGTTKKQLFSISKKSDSNSVEISLLASKGSSDISIDLMHTIIGDAIQEIVFGSFFPDYFIASAERTGSAIFRKELFFARNRLLEKMSLSGNDINPFELLDKAYSDYALPVRRNVEFTRELVSTANKESFIVKKHPQILNYFSNILGGEFKVIKEELYFIPFDNRRVRLTMDESSSSVRSLVDLEFYLRYFAEENDIIIVDEPELNLHPENQRRIARLFARLVNLGIKIFITTHSDYIIKELNTLIMLNNDSRHVNEIAKRNHYDKSELLNFEKLRVYIAKKDLVLLNGNSRRSSVNTLVSADINQETGIEVGSFDKTIDEMNFIQDEILFS